MTDFSSDAIIETGRLTLAPLRVDDAADMVAVLSDDRLHEFIGGRPATLDELRDRYRYLLAGSSDSKRVWLNWTVRLRPERTAVGTIQATVHNDEEPVADVAWVIGVAWQGQGFATQAARALVEWLRLRGVTQIQASIQPHNHASAAVAERAGLTPTGEHRDGETVWRLREEA